MNAAIRELYALVGPEKEADLKRWRERWIDEGAVLVSMTPLEELQQFDEKARAKLLAWRAEAQVVQMARLILGRDGVLGHETHRPAGGGIESRLFLCVVRAEPKDECRAQIERVAAECEAAEQEEARLAKELLDYRDKGIVPPALKAYREREEAQKP